MSYIEELGKRAVEAKVALRKISTAQKNVALENIAKALEVNSDYILRENADDVANAIEKKMKESFVERLALSEERIKNIAKGVRQIIALSDPIGEVIGGRTLRSGLTLVKKRVPLGVLGIIFESRPNVTVDAASLTLKSGNAVILRGGSDAFNSNKALVDIMREAVQKAGLPPDSIIFVEDTSRETATDLMRLNGYIDALIPRGGANLIQSVVKNATVPVIETGAGNCHIYVDESADIEKAVLVTDNAKTQRPSVCNAIENLLVHKNIASEFLPRIAQKWNGRVEIYGDKETEKYIKIARTTSDEDFYEEYNDFKIAVKIVENVQEAVQHIEKYGTHHSDGIITENYSVAREFTENVDSAAVYVNASTRFTDGFEFGLGAEIGISTQKLHARGPMGLSELTTYKYIINGDSQIVT